MVFFDRDHSFRNLFHSEREISIQDIQDIPKELESRELRWFCVFTLVGQKSYYKTRVQFALIHEF